MKTLLNWGLPILVLVVLLIIFWKPVKERAKKLFKIKPKAEEPQSPWTDQEVGEGVEWTSNGSYLLWIVASIFFFYFGITSETKDFAWMMSVLGIITSIMTAYAVGIVPNRPPHFAIITRWGKRLWKRNSKGQLVVVYVNEGYFFLPWKGIKYGAIVINLSKQEIDFPAEVLTTPDNGTVEVPGSLAYTPDKEHIIGFLNLGKDPFKVFKDMMCDIWKDKLRTWARTKDKGPQTWEELLSSDEEAVEILLETICGNVQIPEDSRKAIRAGFGKWPINHFGVILNRLNLTDMKPFGDVYQASVELNKEQRQRKSETYEVGTDTAKAAALQTELKALGKDLPIEECLKMVMDWKITREANQLFTISALASKIATGFKTTANGQS